MQGLMETVKDKLYDTLFLPENMPKLQAYAFALPLGQYAGRKMKTWEHTNLLCSGAMDAPRSFAIREVKCAFFQGGEYMHPFPGALSLFISGNLVRSWKLESISAEDCRSVICSPAGPYAEGFLELENRERPIITELESQVYFNFQLDLERKPDIPTEFVVVLVGDLYRPAPLCRNARA